MTSAAPTSIMKSCYKRVKRSLSEKKIVFMVKIGWNSAGRNKSVFF